MVETFIRPPRLSPVMLVTYGRILGRRLLPQRWHAAARRLVAALCRGRRFECPICLGRFWALLPYGARPRRNAECPRCGALERQRLLWLYLQQHTLILTAPLRVLHMAPEPMLQARLRALPSIRYVSADLATPTAMLHTDVTRLALQSDSMDVILCSHVLEHVADDRQAMRELHRVMKPGGSALLQVPVLREQTFEDPTVRTPLERERIFGQADHVRIYGQDVATRLREAGFTVHVERYGASLHPAQRARYCLDATEDIFRCTKP